VSRHKLARLVVSARDQGDEVSLGEYAYQASIFDYRKTTDLPLSQKARSIDQRGIRPDGDDLGAHHVFDGERVEKLPLGVLAIAKRLRERVAKEIALGHDADEGLIIIIKNGQMAHPTQPHDVVSQRELVIALEGGGIGRHHVANFQAFILTSPKKHFTGSPFALRRNEVRREILDGLLLSALRPFAPSIYR
jgi:hypothetical protein